MLSSGHPYPARTRGSNPVAAVASCGSDLSGIMVLQHQLRECSSGQDGIESQHKTEAGQ